MDSASNRPVAISLRLYRALARAFPHEFKSVYGDELLQVTEDAVEGVWRRHGVWGVLRLLTDVALRLVVERFAEVWRDIRYGIRALAASRGFTVVAVISLALGIAVATSAFSALNGLVLRDVPGIARPDQLFAVQGTVSYPNYLRYSEQTGLFAGTLAYAAPVPFSVTFAGQAERTWGHLVTASYFPTLGVRPLLGRFFGREDEQPVRAPIAVISQRFWRDHLGSDLSVVGRTLQINGQPCAIVGVGPNEFRGASPLAYGADLWLPLSVGARLAPELAGSILERHDRAVFHFVGRLRPGASVLGAQAALDAMARQLEQQYGDPDRDRPGRRVTLLPGGKLVPITKQDLPMVTGFMTVLCGMILLIASLNVTNMTLARATDRRKEIAVRLALGASRGRLIQQLLTESMLMASAAGLLGFLLTSWIMGLAGRMPMRFPMPLDLHLEPDGRVLLFTIGLTVFTGVALGLAPAFRATRTDLTPALKAGGDARFGVRRRLSLRNLLVVSQVAGSLALLLITGFLVIGHRNIAGTEVGFDPRGLHLISVDPVRAGYSGEQGAAFARELLDRLKRVPAVTSASFVDSVPMSMVGKPETAYSAAGPDGSKMLHSARLSAVGRDFFDTFGIPVLRGRAFRQQDEADGSMTAIVSERLARDCWKDQDPIGRRLEIGNEEAPRLSEGGRSPISKRAEAFEIVGVAKDVRDGLNPGPADYPAVIYLPLHPADYARPALHGVTIAVRAAPGVDAIGIVRREMWAIDAKLTPFDARSMAGQIGEMLFPVNVMLWTYTFIGVFGLILTSVGLAGVTAYSVARRRREIGIRVALGARSGDVLRLVMREGTVLVAAGTVTGLALAWAATRMLAAALSFIARTTGKSGPDPVLLVGAPLLLAVLALMACYLPARKSLRVDPVVALRQE
jgi:predicted permease